MHGLDAGVGSFKTGGGSWLRPRFGRGVQIAESGREKLDGSPVTTSLANLAERLIWRT